MGNLKLEFPKHCGKQIKDKNKSKHCVSAQILIDALKEFFRVFNGADMATLMKSIVKESKEAKEEVDEIEKQFELELKPMQVAETETEPEAATPSPEEEGNRGMESQVADQHVLDPSGL